MSADSALVDRIRAMQLDPNHRTSMARFDDGPELYPPVSADLLEESERRIGFLLPPFLRTLYLDVGNGGFGPGYGLWGLQGGYPAPGIPESDTVESYLQTEKRVRPVRRWIVICDWGCCNYSAIDCAF